MPKVTLPFLLEKTASLLEKQARVIQKNTEEKVASHRMEIEHRLTPVFKNYEKVAKTKLSEEQKEKIIEGTDPSMLEIVEKLASKAEEVPYEMGEPTVDREWSLKQSAFSSGETAGNRKVTTGTMGRRRSKEEIKRETKRRESQLGF